MRESHACYIACRERQARRIEMRPWIHTILLAVAVAVLCFVVLRVAKLAKDLDLSVDKLEAYGHGTGPVLFNMLKNVSDTSKVVKDNSAATSTEEKKILGETSELIVLTNTHLYGKSGHPGLIVKAETAMDDLDTAIKGLGELTREASDEMIALRKGTEELTATIGDMRAFGKGENPKVNTMLDEASGSLTAMRKDLTQLGLMLASGTATAEDIRQVADKYREEYLKVRNLAWS